MHRMRARRRRVPRGRRGRRDRRRRRRLRGARGARHRPHRVQPDHRRPGHRARRARRAAQPGAGVADLLARRNAPSRGIDDRKELATPTGVALMTALADEFGPMPAMTCRSVGYGAGTRRHPRSAERRPGGDRRADAPHAIAPTPGQPVRAAGDQRRRCDRRGASPTRSRALLAAGAHDAWATPIVMKKGRPAHTVHALCDPPRRRGALPACWSRDRLARRARHRLHRWPQRRDEATVTSRATRQGEGRAPARVKVEHDDAVAAADGARAGRCGRCSPPPRHSAGQHRRTEQRIEATGSSVRFAGRPVVPVDEHEQPHHRRHGSDRGDAERISKPTSVECAPATSVIVAWSTSTSGYWATPHPITTDATAITAPTWARP